MIVEFIGLPGAGKSTISRALASAHDEVQLGQPGSFCDLVVRPLPASRILWSMRGMLRSLGLKEVAKTTAEFVARPSGITVLDQGGAQRLAAQLLRSRLDAGAGFDITRRCADLASRRLLVDVTVPPSLAAQRLASRSRLIGDIAELPVDDRLPALLRLRSTLDSFSEAGFRVVRVEGVGDIEKSVDRIWDAVNSVRGFG